MSNITITDKGKYYESSCGAWSRDGVTWVVDEAGGILSPARIQRFSFKQQILDGQAAEPEPEVFTGDPVANEWGRGVYESDSSVIVVDSYNRALWYGRGGDILHIGKVHPVSEKFTRISTNPADSISDKVKGVEA